MKKEPLLDRNSVAAAQSVLERLFPSEHERYAVLAYLLKSADAASRIAPNAWAVTLFPTAIRLNVGQVEVFVAAEPGVFLNCAASIGTPPFDTDASEPTRYRSLPSPQCRYWGTVRDLEHLPDEVDKAHRKFVELAARGPSGKPRSGTTFAKTNSPGLLAYAEKFVRGKS